MVEDKTPVPHDGDHADGTGKTSAALVLVQSSFDGSGGRGWTERSEAKEAKEATGFRAGALQPRPPISI